MDENWSIKKHDGNNWNTWKFQMKHLLMAKELWNLVDGSEVLASDASAAVAALFQSQLHKVFSTIILLYWRLTVLSFTWLLRAKNHRNR